MDQNTTPQNERITAERVADIMAKIESELARAVNKHPGKNASRHHHYGVIAEEFREFETCVFKDFVPGGRDEVVQLAAMCVRFLLETPNK